MPYPLYNLHTHPNYRLDRSIYTEPLNPERSAYLTALVEPYRNPLSALASRVAIYLHRWPKTGFLYPRELDKIFLLIALYLFVSSFLDFIVVCFSSKWWLWRHRPSKNRTRRVCYHSRRPWLCEPCTNLWGDRRVSKQSKTAQSLHLFLSFGKFGLWTLVNSSSFLPFVFLQETTVQKFDAIHLWLCVHAHDVILIPERWCSWIKLHFGKFASLICNFLTGSSLRCFSIKEIEKLFCFVC